MFVCFKLRASPIGVDSISREPSITRVFTVEMGQLLFRKVKLYLRALKSVGTLRLSNSLIDTVLSRCLLSEFGQEMHSLALQQVRALPSPGCHPYMARFFLSLCFHSKPCAVVFRDENIIAVTHGIFFLSLQVGSDYVWHIVTSNF